MRTKAFATAVLLLAGLSLAHSISTDSANSTQKKPKFDAAAKEEGEATPFIPMSDKTTGGSIAVIPGWEKGSPILHVSVAKM